jgi:hypothetical protein
MVCRLNTKKTSKPPRKKRVRSYKVVTDLERAKLIEVMETKQISCRAAAQVVGINYNNAKVIARVYRQEGRTKSVPKHLKRIKGFCKRNPGLDPTGQ